MTPEQQAWIAARNEGRAATPGDPNPHAGSGIPAQMWMLGYKTMLVEQMNRSPSYQAFLRGPDAADAE
ncbi:hypothetical protein FGG44_gp11 [Mycobacterium phage MacnCheese]|uniref:Uncharacterized protein n=1 Tax=Mycobacterium phage MacnCheese TaxID=2927982 RepID=I6XD80_9CAUD|nr:hypothetical protein FGG44_gp11 [Mycobacterium phage MacnCheese]AFN37801.1 hypothetical protein MACNCHEESE_11 [Mycobacterium phage MacnCheese]